MAGHCAEYGETIVARPWTEDQIERDAEPGGDEARPLQDADRARQITKPELIDEGENQDRVDGHKPQGIERP